jgi:hypothetical protein
MKNANEVNTIYDVGNGAFLKNKYYYVVSFLVLGGHQVFEIYSKRLTLERGTVQRRHASSSRAPNLLSSAHAHDLSFLLAKRQTRHAK